MNWVLPALLIMLVGWIGSWLVLSQESIRHQTSQIQERALQQQVEKGKMTKEQLEAARPTMEKFSEVSILAGAIAGPPLYAFAAPFWWGLVLWLLGTQVFKAEFSYMKGVEAAGLANGIIILESAVKTLLILAMDNVMASPSLALFLGKGFDALNRVHGLLAACNFFTFWVIGVRAVALSRLAKVSFGKTFAWLLGIWVAVTGLIFGMSALLQKIGGG